MSIIVPWPSSTDSALLAFGDQPDRSALVIGMIYDSSVIAIGHAAMQVLTWMFLVGITGSLLVVVISFVEDLTELVGKE